MPYLTWERVERALLPSADLHTRMRNGSSVSSQLLSASRIRTGADSLSETMGVHVRFGMP